MFFEAIFLWNGTKNGANVICISQGVIIFCAPNKTNKKKVTGAGLSCFSCYTALNWELSWWFLFTWNYSVSIFTHTVLSDNFLDIKIFL